MQILNFFKSFVSPIRMVKFRYMSILISISIFILASYLLALPRSVYLNNNINKLVETENYYYLQGLTQIPEADEVINQTIATINGFELEMDEDGFLKSDKLAALEVQPNYYDTNIIYTNDAGRIVNIKIVIDLVDVETKYNYNELFKYSEESFPNIETTEYYLIIVERSDILYLANPIGLAEHEVKRDDIPIGNMSTRAIHSQTRFSPANLGSTGEEFGKYLSDVIGKGFVTTENSYFSIFVFIFCLIFPLIMITLFWLFCRKNGRLKTFKEYYNIAAICSIIPVLVTFITCWIWPLSDMIFSTYILVFCLYYLFMLYKINSTMDLM